MGEPIYVPSSGVWTDSPKICIVDLFPSLSVQDADKKMTEAAESMAGWLESNGINGLGIQWRNVLSPENPAGEVGFFRFYRK